MPSEICVWKKPWFSVIRWIPLHTLATGSTLVCIYYSIPKDTYIYNALVYDNDPEHRLQIYRWWTYSLLHYNKAHLYTNLVMLLGLGTMLELETFWRMILVYHVAILGGAVGTGWQNRFDKEPMYLVGASGGIYGLLASQTGHLILNYPEMGFLERYASISTLVTVTTANIVTNIIKPNPAVSYSTHVGGFVAGAIGSICFVKNRKKYKWETGLKIASGVALGCYLLSGFINLGLGFA